MIHQKMQKIIGVTKRADLDVVLFVGLIVYLERIVMIGII